MILCKYRGKRTAVIFANHYLISRGKGLIAIPVELVSKYKKMFIDYYEDKNDDIKNFLKENVTVHWAINN
ncbi:MAG TPA: hypothetical protein PK554_02130 [Bacilli bacterium]|jgi:hypothetical protein|nr:hypothetical protein [Acholeplasmataceae bacterium]HNZ77802.1 hypothetical protein [Bacilli bacterium]HOH61091.1 hypothetical protein [Bacilli bacterium]HPB48695.1 hypothetical protein [Bacilli bacterium]HPM14892.1 hypothetical protein [Bacilli bacterium]